MRAVIHRYRGPRVSTDGTAFAALCVCGWRGPERYSRVQAKADFQHHKTREARDLADDIRHDRDRDA